MIKVLLAIIILSAIACNNGSGYISKDENGGDVVIGLTGDDEEMNNAIAKAKKEYPLFLEAFKSNDSSLSDFSIKMRFDFGDGGGEHMWLSDLHFRKNELVGVLDSDPVNIHSVKSGDSLVIERDKVSDWMYVKDDVLIGGYTIKALYYKMSDAEKKEFLDQLPFSIQ